MWPQWGGVASAAAPMPPMPAPQCPPPQPPQPPPPSTVPPSADTTSGTATPMIGPMLPGAIQTATAVAITPSATTAATFPMSGISADANNPYGQYTAAQYAAMTPEQQYALQQHWQQWQAYQQEYAKWHAQYGEQYKREMAAVAATGQQPAAYPNYYQQQQVPRQPPPPPPDDTQQQKTGKISGQPQMYSQPPPQQLPSTQQPQPPPATAEQNHNYQQQQQQWLSNSSYNPTPQKPPAAQSQSPYSFNQPPPNFNLPPASNFNAMPNFQQPPPMQNQPQTTAQNWSNRDQQKPSQPLQQTERDPNQNNNNQSSSRGRSGGGPWLQSPNQCQNEGGNSGTRSWNYNQNQSGGGNQWPRNPDDKNEATNRKHFDETSNDSQNTRWGPSHDNSDNTDCQQENRRDSIGGNRWGAANNVNTNDGDENACWSDQSNRGGQQVPWNNRNRDAYHGPNNNNQNNFGDQRNQSDRRSFNPQADGPRNNNRDRFFSGDEHIGRSNRNSGPNDGNFGQNERNFGPNDRSFGPNGPNGRNFGPNAPNDRNFGANGPNDRNFVPNGPNDRNFGPNVRNFGPNRNSGPSERNFGPNDRKFGSNDRNIGPTDRNFGPNERNFGPNEGNFGSNNFGSNFNQDFSPKGPRNSFGSNQGVNMNANRQTQQQQRPELDEESFDRQFRQWEQQFEDWKRANANHPDREMYKRYEEEFEKQRKRIMERREQMRRRRMEQMSMQTKNAAPLPSPITMCGPSTSQKPENMQSTTQVASVSPTDIAKKEDKEGDSNQKHQSTNENKPISKVPNPKGTSKTSTDSTEEKPCHEAEPSVVKAEQSKSPTAGKNSSCSAAPNAPKRKSRFSTCEPEKKVAKTTEATSAVILLDDEDEAQNLDKSVEPISDLFKKSEGIPGLDLVDKIDEKTETEKVEEVVDLDTDKDAPQQSAKSSTSNTQAKKIPSLFDIVIDKPPSPTQPAAAPGNNAAIQHTLHPTIANEIPNLNVVLKDPVFMSKITEALAKAQGQENPDPGVAPPAQFLQQLPLLLKQLEQQRGNNENNGGNDGEGQMSFAEWQRTKGQGQGGPDCPNRGYGPDMNCGPNFGGNGPNFDGNGPNFGPNGPNFNRFGPNFSGNNPNLNHNNGGGPNFGRNGPFGGNGLNFGGNGPNFCGNGPNFGGNGPNFGGNGPNFGGNRGNFGPNGPHFNCGPNGPNMHGPNGPNFGGNGPNYNRGGDGPNFRGNNNRNFGGNGPNFNSNEGNNNNSNERNTGNPFRRSGGPTAPVFDDDNSGGKKRFSRGGPGSDGSGMNDGNSNSSWLNGPGSNRDYDDYYRPVQVIDYQNSTMTPKVIDYGHKASGIANVAAISGSGFNASSFSEEFKPVRTFDYGHASNPTGPRFGGGPGQKKNNKKNKNKNKPLGKPFDQKNENTLQKPLQQNQQLHQEEKQQQGNNTQNQQSTAPNTQDQIDMQQIQNKQNSTYESEQETQPKAENATADTSNIESSKQSGNEELEEISDTEETLVEDNRDDDSPPPPPPPMFTRDAPYTPPVQANVSAVPKSIFPSTAAANENIKKTPAGHVQMSFPSVENQNTISVDEILQKPGRMTRPKKICIILRGPPGSGKSHVAKLIKEKEMEMGGANPRILSIDDYFLIENDYEERCPKTGKKIPKKEILYEYDKAMEETYMQYLIKQFKKTISDNLYDFIIVDCNNNSLRTLNEFYCHSKDSGFMPYIIDLYCDLETCVNRNIHERTEKDIEAVIDTWNATPLHYIKLDVSSLLENVVEMEDAEDMVMDSNFNSETADSSNLTQPQTDKEEDSNEAADAAESCGFLKSKWENDTTSENLARLDGTNKLMQKRKAATMEDYLQMDDWEPPTTSADGKKRVRWADIEEKRAQEKMRAIGFVVGQTDWKRMMDPNAGNRALNKTKYIERVNKRR